MQEKSQTDGHYPDQSVLSKVQAKPPALFTAIVTLPAEVEVIWGQGYGWSALCEGHKSNI